ncbi:nucleotide exchange factor GrpE [bacterium]|nr:nucleotide exchange factor GrpE [bacterium]
MKEKPPDRNKRLIPEESGAGPSGGGPHEPEAVHGRDGTPKIAGEELEGAISLALSKESLKVDLLKNDPPPAEQKDELHTTVGELAEDMLGLLKMVSAIDKKLSLLTSAISTLQQTLEAFSRSIGLELTHLKENLVSDRKEFIGRSTFNAIMPAMETLKAMKKHLSDQEKDREILQNTNTLLDLLTGISQALRYTSFDVPPGSDFDPQMMECMGYEEGEDGKVVRVEQSGYKAGHVLVKPCLVILGKKTGGTNRKSPA